MHLDPPASGPNSAIVRDRESFRNAAALVLIRFHRPSRASSTGLALTSTCRRSGCPSRPFTFSNAATSRGSGRSKFLGNMRIDAREVQQGGLEPVHILYVKSEVIEGVTEREYLRHSTASLYRGTARVQGDCR